MKKCGRCNRFKQIICFGKNSSKKDGLTSYCKECIKLYYKDTKHEKSEYDRNRYKNTKNKRRELDKIWTKNNKDKKNFICAKRRASKLKATPPWLTNDQLAEIANIYKQAKQLEKETGLKHHVDHIIPLQGKEVCGLHTPWNLQVLTAEENLKKGSKYEQV